MIDFETWWNSSSADEFRRLNDDMDGRVVRPVWDAAIRATLSSQKATSAAPSPEATQPSKWIDDPHDIEQGQMLNPAWLKTHGLTAAEATQPTQAEAPLLTDDRILELSGQSGGFAINLARAVERDVRAALATQQVEPEVERTPLSISRMACLIDEEARYAYQEIQRLVKTINYMVGIAERGRGVKCPPEEFPEKFLLDYIKELESTQQSVQAEPAAWQDPETLDVIASGRKADWMTNHGHGGRKKAVSYTTPLYATPPDPGRVARHDKTCASLLDGGAAGPCDCSAPGQVDRDREDAESYRWLCEVIGTADENKRDRAIRSLEKAAPNPKTPQEFDAAIRAARSSEGGGNEHSR